MNEYTKEVIKSYEDPNAVKTGVFLLGKGPDEDVLTVWRQLSVFAQSFYFWAISHRVATGFLTFGVAGVGVAVYVVADLKKHKDKVNLRNFSYHKERLAQANHILNSEEFAEQLKAFGIHELENIKVKANALQLSDLEKEAYINKELEQALNQWLETNFPDQKLQVYRNKTYILPTERGVNPHPKIAQRLQEMSDRMFTYEKDKKKCKKYEVSFEDDSNNKRKKKFLFKPTVEWETEFSRRKEEQKKAIAQLPLWLRFFRFSTITDIIGDEDPKKDLEDFNKSTGFKLFYKKPASDPRYDLNKGEHVALAITENAAMARIASPVWASISIVAFMYWLVWMSYFNMHGVATGFAAFGALTISTGFIFFGIPLAMGLLFLVGYAIWHLTNNSKRELTTSKQQDQQFLLQSYFIEERAAFLKDKLQSTPYANEGLEGSEFDGDKKYPGLTRFKKVAALVEETEVDRVVELLKNDFDIPSEYDFKYYIQHLDNLNTLRDLDDLYEDLTSKGNIIIPKKSEGADLKAYVEKQVDKTRAMTGNRLRSIFGGISEKSVERLQIKLGVDKVTATNLLLDKKDVDYQNALVTAQSDFKAKWDKHEAALAKRQFMAVCEKVVARTKVLADYNYKRDEIVEANNLVKSRISAEHKIASYISRVLTLNMSQVNLQSETAQKIKTAYDRNVRTKGKDKTWSQVQDEIYNQTITDHTQKLINKFNEDIVSKVFFEESENLDGFNKAVEKNTQWNQLNKAIGLTPEEMNALTFVNDAIFGELQKTFSSKVANQIVDKEAFKAANDKFREEHRAEKTRITKVYEKVTDAWYAFKFFDSKPKDSYRKAPEYIRRLRRGRMGFGAILRGSIFGGFGGFMEAGFAGWIITDFLFYVCGVAGALLTGATLATPLVFGLVLGFTLLFTAYAAIKASQKHKETLKKIDTLEEELSTQEKVHNFVELENIIEKVKSLKVEVNNLRSDIDLLLIEKCRTTPGDKNSPIDFGKLKVLRAIYNEKIDFPDFTNDHFYRLMRTDESHWGIVRKILWRISSLVDGAGGGSYLGRFFFLPAMGCTILALAVTSPHLALLFILICAVTIASMKIYRMSVQRQRDRDDVKLNETKVRIKGLDEQETILLMHQQKLQQQFMELMGESENSESDALNIPTSSSFKEDPNQDRTQYSSESENDVSQASESEFSDTASSSNASEASESESDTSNSDTSNSDTSSSVSSKAAYISITGLSTNQQTTVAKGVLSSLCRDLGVFNKSSTFESTNCREEHEQEANKVIVESSPICVI